MYQPITENENKIASIVMDVAFSIHRALGPGLLESVYKKCFCHELQQKQIPYLRQQMVPTHYKDLIVKDDLRLDLFIDDCFIVELKAQENYHPVWEAQLLSYLKLTVIWIGYLINFHVPLMKNGLKRIVL